MMFMLESAIHGFPVGHCEIKQNTNAILQSKQGPDYEGVGKQWVFNFLTQHYDVLQPHWSQPLDTQRAKSLNPTAVKSWFNIVEKFTVKLKLDQRIFMGWMKVDSLWCIREKRGLLVLVERRLSTNKEVLTAKMSPP